MSSRILVVDDDSEIRTLLGRYLDEHGFSVTLAASHAEFLKHFRADAFDLVVLDVMLPDASGLDICRDLRRGDENVPVILVTALHEDVDRILGLELGADDYLPKPFNPRELIARIKAVLRRAEGSHAQLPEAVRYWFGPFVADLVGGVVVTRSGAEVPLTGAEFELLKAFLSRPGTVLSRDHLLSASQGRRPGLFDRSVDVLVSRLRRKFREAGASDLFRTVRNGGYQLTVKVHASEAGS